MHILLAIGVAILTAGATGAQRATLAATEPIHVTFVKATFEEALGSLARVAKVTIEIDRSVTAEVRQQLINNTPVRIAGATLEQTIDLLTRQMGLSYTIVDTRLVRIFKQ